MRVGAEVGLRGRLCGGPWLLSSGIDVWYVDVKQALMVSSLCYEIGTHLVFEEAALRFLCLRCAVGRYEATIIRGRGRLTQPPCFGGDLDYMRILLTIMHKIGVTDVLNKQS